MPSFTGCRFLSLISLLILLVSSSSITSRTAQAAAPSKAVAASAKVYGVFIVKGSVYLVDAHGRVVASASGRGPSCCKEGGDFTPAGAAAKTCCVLPGAAIVYPTHVSATRTRVYYLDGDTRVMSLSPDGHTRLAARVTGGPSTVIGFAVSPDDRRVAVAVRTYLPLAGHTNYVDARNHLRLYIEDLGTGAHHRDIFEQTFDFETSEWPVGWYHGDLLMAVGYPAAQQYAWQNPYAAANGYHLVNPDNGQRLATICAGNYRTGISPSGPLSQAGTACWHRSTDSSAPASLYDAHWDGSITTFTTQLQTTYAGFVNGAVSPDGSSIALSCGDALCLARAGGAATSLPFQLAAWGWLDSRHLIVAKSSTGAAGLAVLDLNSGSLAPIALSGDYITAFAYLGTFPSQMSS